MNVSQPDFGPSEAAAVQAVMASDWVGRGPKTLAFEAVLAERISERYFIASVSHFLRHARPAARRRKMRESNAITA